MHSLTNSQVLSVFGGEQNAQVIINESPGSNIFIQNDADSASPVTSQPICFKIQINVGANVPLDELSVFITL
tara:strand:+ start:85 stop:300 length:216 start_codon:yes stop_codon:yes gene_type:complete